MGMVLRAIAPLFIVMAATLHAQDVTGKWQGTLGSGKQALRLILDVAKPDGGSRKAFLVSVDQGGFDQPIPADTQRRRGVLHHPITCGSSQWIAASSWKCSIGAAQEDQ